jgi:hypothetical protein
VDFMRTTKKASVCEEGKSLSIEDVEVYRAAAGDKFNLKAWSGVGGVSYSFSVRKGVLQSSRQEIY